MSKYYNTFFGSYIEIGKKDALEGLTGSSIDGYADSISREYGVSDKIEHLEHLEKAFGKPENFFKEAKENIATFPKKLLVKESYALGKAISEGYTDEEARKIAKQKTKKYYDKLMRDHNRRFPDSVMKSLTHAGNVKVKI